MDPVTVHPYQWILFGSPGTGKSHKIDEHVKAMVPSPFVVKTIFHPEYTHGDFMGRLMPLSQPDGRVSYRYYPGHFMRALAKALSYHHEAIQVNPPVPPKEVLLVIDEINRGNSAAIFGTAFQLLDRREDGWSSYDVDLSEMEHDALLQMMGVHQCIRYPSMYESEKEGRKKLNELFAGDLDFLAERKIKLPPNLRLAGTMNTSDESIYYMDSAFKRRWSWEYVPIDNGNPCSPPDDLNEDSWRAFVRKLNAFILSHAASIRKVEDKLIGYYFIRTRKGVVAGSEIQNKLMFFLWDTVFIRDKRLLEQFFGDNKELKTFGDFSAKSALFVERIQAWSGK
ncbi:restriction endonuclease [Janthinobacterium sp. KBS0711]|uniref:AAA family ATPase n=1 Tax=Janthinobacterium sp. KBS0711 TaxID=1649647 RepID=UPI0006275709|nr:AAA family ATPase [Janthinobacterium sp. KBS0711]TSD70007.1 restriction endonuclease [Janthinobacterium sp. KBS0711]